MARTHPAPSRDDRTGSYESIVWAFEVTGRFRMSTSAMARQTSFDRKLDGYRLVLQCCIWSLGLLRLRNFVTEFLNKVTVYYIKVGKHLFNSLGRFVSQSHIRSSTAKVSKVAFPRMRSSWFALAHLEMELRCSASPVACPLMAVKFAAGSTCRISQSLTKLWGEMPANQSDVGEAAQRGSKDESLAE